MQRLTWQTFFYRSSSFPTCFLKQKKIKCTFRLLNSIFPLNKLLKSSVSEPFKLIYINLFSYLWWLRYMFSPSDKSWYLNQRRCSRWDFAVLRLCVINGCLCAEPALFQTWSKLLAKWSHGGDTSRNAIKQSGCSPALDGQEFFFFYNWGFLLSQVAKMHNVCTHTAENRHCF